MIRTEMTRDHNMCSLHDFVIFWFSDGVLFSFMKRLIAVYTISAEKCPVTLLTPEVLHKIPLCSANFKEVSDDLINVNLIMISN